MNPLAVQLYSVRDQMARDPAAVLERLAEIGYGAVEAYDPADNPDRFRSIVDGVGLGVCSTHAPLLDGNQDELLDAAATIGASTVIVTSALPAERWATRDGLVDIAKELNAAAENAAGRGIRIGYHNHQWEFEHRVDERFALEVVADMLDPRVILEVDIYWAQVGGAEVPALLHRLGERVRYLHVKDGPATKEGPMTAVGRGVLPVPDILRASPAVEWHVVELDWCATDMVQALADSVTYLNQSGIGVS